MKRLMIAVVAVALTLPAMAWGASQYSSSFQAGKYTGKITSVVPELNGETVTMELKTVGDKNIGTVEYKGGKEIWVWDDKTLDQKEIDAKTNKESMSYGATATDNPTGTTQTYNINCKDRDNNVCDAGADYRFSWTLEGKPNTVKYTVYGVDKTAKADKNVKAAKRHEFVFTLNK